ncbi:MAG TPA: PPOX class F420-dependent oxidoreductase [Actinophytocola sp.]|jgi:PPOX class probable F420-dependent enzyme|nr:PPOX class F420-dependent oxidoreductase [Actinophytocola sp.]
MDGETRSALGARRWSRPVAGRKLPGGRVADRLSRPSPSIIELLDALPPETARDPRTARGRHTVLVTFRRNGIRVATPVWAATVDGVLYARTQRASGKVKRLRNNGTVQLAPCSTRGIPLAAPVPGHARLLGPGEEHVAEAALRRAHGPVRAFCAAVQDMFRVDMCYLAVTVDDAVEG